jgi:uracil phosphoribosyltransferase
MKYQKVNVQVLPQTPVVRAAVARFCEPRTSPKDRHAAISDLTKMVAGSIEEIPSYKYPREGCNGKTEMLTDVAYQRLVGVPVVRAGVAMAGAFKSVVPAASIRLIGAKRVHNEKGQIMAQTYLDELDDHMDSKSAYFLDTVLATGVSLGAAIDIAKEKGCRDINVLTAIAAPEGVAELNKLHPDAKIYAATMAEGINEKSYIYNPTPGDAGDNLFGPEEPWQNVVKNYKSDETLAYYTR